ncbi:NADH-quinone oxidoreductase subunit K [Oligoflexus tunisiensis]|uniref:NADH-quinone oxidoreductase subunit K n=1 Tax=Oligoflexus tunisiensis TaxID=708132 RepID=UPI001C4024F4|nr:NADH-quinone oxidoreductase subunit K [Oligoflexus tunisiensis]
MMPNILSPYLLHAITGAMLIGMAVYSMAIHVHILRKILAWNILGSGVFLIMGAFGKRNAVGAVADPLPQAVVITGIVVSVSATALALTIAHRLYVLTRDSTLEPDHMTPAHPDPNKAKQDIHAE